MSRTGLVGVMFMARNILPPPLLRKDGAPAYDNNGNRKTKTDATDPLNVVRVYYEHDIDYPSDYGTADNRLMYYETRDITVPEVGLLSTTYYYYNPFGNVSRIVTNVEGTDQYSSTWLVYARNGATVSYVVGETWDEGLGSCPTNYDITFAREFRYDGARERYLNRELDPVALLSGNIVEVAAGTYWSDYGERSEREWAAIGKASRDARDRPTTCPEQVSTMRTCGGRGDIYGDYTADQGTPTETMSYQLGLARVTDPLGTPATEYYHTDHLGTTRFMGSRFGMRSFTAFGEHVAGATGRYDYAGAWGYQTHDDFPFLHVGARYYDPATGRFLQRDPIGIEGGLNVYVYVQNNPLFYIDPSGLGPKWDWIKDKAKKIWDVAKRLPPYILPSSPIPADAAPGVACIYMLGGYRKHIEDSHDDNLPDENCPTCKRLQPK